MSIWLYITDVHTSTSPPPGRTTEPFYGVATAKLRALVERHKPAGILCGGDLFHSRTGGRPNPSIWHVLALREFMYEDLGLPWLVNPGNHDLAYDTTGEKGLSPLSLLEGDLVFVQWQPFQTWTLGTAGVHAVPYGSELFCDNEPWPVVMTHHNIALSGTVPQIREQVWSPPELQEDFRGVQTVLCGHIHLPFDVTTGETRWVNPGPFVRRTTDELRAACSYAVLVDLDTGECEVIPAEPLNDVRVVEEEHRQVIDMSAVVRHMDFTKPLTVETLAETIYAWADAQGMWLDDEVVAKAVALAASTEKG